MPPKIKFACRWLAVTWTQLWILAVSLISISSWWRVAEPTSGTVQYIGALIYRPSFRESPKLSFSITDPDLNIWTKIFPRFKVVWVHTGTPYITLSTIDLYKSNLRSIFLLSLIFQVESDHFFGFENVQIRSFESVLRPLALGSIRS